MNISLTFLNYNSIDYIEQQLSRNYIELTNNLIDEILILDDCSDNNEYERLLTFQTKSIKVFRNEKNLKPLLSRVNIVKQCKNDFVLLMDSDNFIDIKSLLNFIANEKLLHSNIIYCPDFARPNFNYKQLSDKIIDIVFARQYIGYICCFLNTGNYLVHKNTYLEVANKIDNHYADYIMEVLYFNFLWLSSGNYLKCVNNFEYDHGMRASCYSNTGKNDNIISDIFHLYQNHHI
jgi:hypothetical protein